MRLDKAAPIKNVLVFCPMSPTMPRLWGRTVQSLFKLRSETIGIDYWLRGWDNPYEYPYENVTHNYNIARDLVLRMGFDALLTVECDMIIPTDTVDRLAATGADIAYGLYVWRHGRREWSAYTYLKGLTGKSISKDPAAARAAWGKVVDVAGVGQGCTLIKRHVLELITFSLWPGTPQAVSSDWMLALDAQRLGFTQRCDLGVVCGHQTYEPWPQVIWPDPEKDDLYRVEALPDPVNGKLPIRVVRHGESMEVTLGELGGQKEILTVRNMEEGIR